MERLCLRYLSRLPRMRECVTRKRDLSDDQIPVLIARDHSTTDAVLEKADTRLCARCRNQVPAQLPSDDGDAWSATLTPALFLTEAICVANT